MRQRDRRPWGVFDLDGKLVTTYKTEAKARSHVTQVDQALPIVERHGRQVQDKTHMVTYHWIGYGAED